MSFADAVDAAPDYLQDPAAEVGSALALVAQVFRDLGIPLDAEAALPFVAMILDRADAAFADFEEETEEDDDMLVVGA
jgi:hypothetical protein